MRGPSRRQLLTWGLSGAGAALLAGCASAPVGVRRSVHRYGSQPFQDVELWRPAEPVGTVVLVHGGYWRQDRRRTQLDRVAAELALRGWAVWNVDYRGYGEGGGWPTTFEDAAAAADLLADVAPAQAVPTAPLVTLGHSAGGTLALWLAARHTLPASAPGGPPRLTVDAAASSAGVNDLTRAARLHLGQSAVTDLVGGPPDLVPDHYALVDPIRLVPLRVPLLVLAGTADPVLPLEQTTAFAAAARAAGDDVRLDVLPGETHGSVLDPGSRGLRLTLDWVDARRTVSATTIAPPAVAQRR